MKLPVFPLSILLTFVVPAAVFSQFNNDESLTGLQRLENLTDRWIQLELDQAKALREWEIEKEVSGQHIAALEAEKSVLQTQLDTVNSQLTSSSTLIAELSASLDKERLLLDRLEAALPGIESRILAMEPALPPPLRKELASTLTRMKENQGAETTSSVARRLQGVLFVLTNMERFNNTITINREIFEENGTEYQVEVLYWGLGTGYAFLPQQNKAWILNATMEGWHWQRNDEAAPAIARAIEVFEKRREPGLVSLPVNLKGGTE